MMTKLYGSAVGIYVVPLMISFVALGGMNGTIITGSRLIQSVANEKNFPRMLAAIHSKFRTPYIAILFQALLATVFVFIGDFSFLITAFSFTVWIFYGLGATSILILRRRDPDRTRAFKNPIIIPVTFILISLLLIAVPFFSSNLFIPALCCFGFILLGVFVFISKNFVKERKKRRLERKN